MKTTMLLTHEYYPFKGGVARYCHSLFKSAPQGSLVIVTDQKDVIAPGHKVLVTSLVSKHLRPAWLRSIATVAMIARTYHIERIVTPNILPLGSIAYGLKKILNIPYILSLHGLDIRLAIERRRAFTKKILSNATHIITNSESTKHIVDALSIRTPITVLTPSIDIDSLRIDRDHCKQVRTSLEGMKVILSVGRLTERKGQDMIIRALPRLLSSIPNVMYVVVGDGPDYARLMRVAQEYRVAEHIRWLPSVSDTEKPSYYVTADVFALPTRSHGPDVEGFGIVYLEASYFGLPIIAGQSGGEREALGANGSALFVDGSNEDQVVEALRGILEDAELASFLGSNARTHFMTLPTPEQQAQKMQALLS